ncbi:MAG: DNA repair protein RecO [Gemmatimonadetes bacterium]|nr:DNA repair protein RecO [Gemmatimonadota bacterium]
MPLVATDGIVLHAIDYMETSRIVRLATRDVGLQSVIAKGARRTRGRHGASLDLFAEGAAHLSLRPGRDLHTLTGFDVTRSRPELAADMGRFTAASAIAELVLRFAHDDEHAALYDTLLATLDAIAGAPPGRARVAALAGAWRLVAELGFAPALDRCALCHRPLDPAADAGFSHRDGGALCPACARQRTGVRALPAPARTALRHWVAEAGDASTPGDLDDATGRAHQRLLREFLHEHLADGRPLRAFDMWEGARWAGG